MKKNLWKNIVLGLLVLLAVVQFANQRVTMDRLERQRQQQLEILKEVKEENRRLEQDVQNLNSPEYIEKQARERLKMIKPDEVPIQNSQDTTPGSTGGN